MHGCGPHNKKMIIAESFDFAADEALQEKEVFEFLVVETKLIGIILLTLILNSFGI